MTINKSYKIIQFCTLFLMLSFHESIKASPPTIELLNTDNGVIEILIDEKEEVTVHIISLNQEIPVNVVKKTKAYLKVTELTEGEYIILAFNSKGEYQEVKTTVKN